MDLIKAIIVGIIQGLTEFLPVSSSGHIELGQAILGLNFKEKEDQFSIILHLGTALSTIVVFRTEILELLKGIFQFKFMDEITTKESDTLDNIHYFIGQNVASLLDKKLKS